MQGPATYFCKSSHHVLEPRKVEQSGSAPKDVNNRFGSERRPLRGIQGMRPPRLSGRPDELKRDTTRTRSFIGIGLIGLHIGLIGLIGLHIGLHVP